MPRRNTRKITYPHSEKQQYHVGSVVFLPFVIIKDDGENGWIMEPSHDTVSVSNGLGCVYVPKDGVLP